MFFYSSDFSFLIMFTHFLRMLQLLSSTLRPVLLHEHPAKTTAFLKYRHFPQSMIKGPKYDRPAIPYYAHFIRPGKSANLCCFKSR